MKPILFITYYRTAPRGQLGVFKRCSRLMEVLLGEYDVHVLHFGGVPPGEAQFAAIRDRVTVHEVPAGEPGDAMAAIMTAVRPHAVIFGEAPIRGPFRLSHRIARSLGLWQVGIENVFDFHYPAYAEAEWPDVDRWLFFGMLGDRKLPLRLTEASIVVPAMLRFPPGFGAFVRDRISVIAYDEPTLRMALRLLELSSRAQKVDFFVSAETRTLLEERRPAGELRVLELPDDATIYDSLARARLVVGKSGYGQITESLQLGARIVCRACAGAITPGLLAPFLQPYVMIVESDDELAARMPQIEQWLAAPPVSAWVGVAKRHPDTIALAARKLAELIEERDPPARPRRVPAPVRNGFPRALHLFRSAVENKRWRDVVRQLRGAPPVWTFDRPMAHDEFADTLERVFADAIDLKLLNLGIVKEKQYDGLVHVSQTCALMWGERGSWKHHEATFDLHVACRAERDEESLAYLGITAASPEP